MVVDTTVLFAEDGHARSVLGMRVSSGHAHNSAKGASLLAAIMCLQVFHCVIIRVLGQENQDSAAKRTFNVR